MKFVFVFYMLFYFLLEKKEEIVYIVSIFLIYLYLVVSLVYFNLLVDI